MNVVIAGEGGREGGSREGGREGGSREIGRKGGKEAYTYLC